MNERVQIVAYIRYGSGEVGWSRGLKVFVSFRIEWKEMC
jgi:hypothetical protein